MIERRRDQRPLVEDQPMGQLQHVGVAEVGSDQVLAGGEGRRRQNAGGYEVLLFLVMHVELYIQLLLRTLDDGVTHAASVGLLQIQALRVIVVPGRIHQEVEARREVPVMLSIAVNDVRLFRRGAGLGRQTRRLR